VGAVKVAGFIGFHQGSKGNGQRSPSTINGSSEISGPLISSFIPRGRQRSGRACPLQHCPVAHARLTCTHVRLKKIQDVPSGFAQELSNSSRNSQSLGKIWRSHALIGWCVSGTKKILRIRRSLRIVESMPKFRAGEIKYPCGRQKKTFSRIIAHTGDEKMRKSSHSQEQKSKIDEEDQRHKSEEKGGRRKQRNQQSATFNKN